MSYTVINAMTGEAREVESPADVPLCVGMSEGNILDFTDGVNDVILKREMKDEDEPVESLGSVSLYWVNTARDLTHDDFKEFCNNFPKDDPDSWDDYWNNCVPF